MRKPIQAAMSCHFRVNSYRSHATETPQNKAENRGETFQYESFLSRGAKLAAGHCPKKPPSQFGGRAKTRPQREVAMLVCSAFDGKTPSTSRMWWTHGQLFSCTLTLSCFLYFFVYVYVCVLSEYVGPISEFFKDDRKNPLEIRLLRVAFCTVLD